MAGKRRSRKHKSSWSGGGRTTRHPKTKAAVKRMPNIGRVPNITIINAAPKEAPKGKAMTPKQAMYFGKGRSTRPPRPFTRRARSHFQTRFIQLRTSGPKHRRYRAVRGGVRGGLAPAGKWMSKEDAHKIVGALPGTALVLGAAGVGAQMLRDNQTVNELAAKVPGGKNSLALGVGVAMGYLAFKYKSLIALLSGLGLAAYALVKFATKESRILDEAGNLVTDDGLPPSSASTSFAEPTPGQQVVTPGGGVVEVLPSQKIAAGDKFKEGDKLFDAGDYENAVAAYEQSLQISKNAMVLFPIAQCYRKLAEKEAETNPTKSTNHARIAIECYEDFIKRAQPNLAVKSAALLEWKKTARTLAMELRKKFFGEKPQEDLRDEKIVAGIDGVTLDVSGEVDDVEGDDDLEGDDELDGDDDDLEGDDELDGDDDDLEGDDDD